MRKLMMAAAMAAGLMAMTPHLATAAEDAASQATPAKIALARRMFVAMHIDKTVNSMMEQMVPPMIDAQLKTHPELKPAEVQAIKEAVNETMQEYLQEDMPNVFDKMIVVYAGELTEDELTQIDAFYESPVGQSLIAKLPQIMAKAMPVITEDMPQMQAKMQGKIEAKVCAKLNCKAKSAPVGKTS